MKRTNEFIWESSIRGVERRLRFWESQNFTLKGKVLVVNVLMSKIWCVLSVTPLSFNIYKNIKQIVLNFLWGKGRAKVTSDTLIGAKEEGGLGLFTIPFIRMKSLKIKIVKKKFRSRKHGHKEGGYEILSKEVWGF